MNKREARKAIKSYFKQVKFHLSFFDTCKGILADVEYEDYLPEFTVKRDLGKILGKGYLLNVKRECSDELYNEIIRFLLSDKNGTKTLLMMMGNYISPCLSQNIL